MTSISSSLSFVSNINHHSSLDPLFSQKHILKPKRHDHHHHVSRVACCSNNRGNTTPPNSNGGHRRDVLISLGGLCGAAGANLINSPFAIADPVIPNYKNCVQAEIPDCGKPPFDCCPPPTSTDVQPFQLPSYSGTSPRVRPAAHLVTDEYLAKYERAIGIMRSLPPNDPHSLISQANIHCAYCNAFYHQKGFPGIQFQVHDSWLFFPFHRWYLYFFERIAGHLIEDPTFAIPFWNYDSPDDGMRMPYIFTSNPKSPLYDPLRNTYHVPPTIVDLDYPNNGGCEGDWDTNSTIMYRQVVSNGKTRAQFFGDAYRAGYEPARRRGSVENCPHNSVHNWTGDGNQPNGENMGVFYSAGRDPIFYSHHANIDRIWNVWKSEFGGNDFDDQDWLKSEFVLFDENKNPVSVKVEDCLNTAEQLGYIYEDVGVPWKDSKPTPCRSRAQRLAAKKQLGLRNDDVKFPLVLGFRVVRIEVKRPRKSRSRQEKKKAEELLVIEGIEYDGQKPVKFDVIVDDDDDGKLVRAKNTEFAGSFVSVPHSSHGMKMKTNLKLALTDLLDDLEADHDDSIMITLVLRTGQWVNIENIKIELGD